MVHRWIQNVVHAIEHLHQSGILHRDIKPDNMLLDLNGMCMLCDFGWTRGLAIPGQPQSRAVETLTMRPGSEDYRAPEGEVC